MSRPTQVHLVTLMVVDTDDMGADEVRALLEHAKYVSPSVLEIRTAEVDWSDDHPLNKADGWERAVADLFPR